MAVWEVIVTRYGTIDFSEGIVAVGETEFIRETQEKYQIKGPYA